MKRFDNVLERNIKQIQAINFNWGSPGAWVAPEIQVNSSSQWGGSHYQSKLLTLLDAHIITAKCFGQVIMFIEGKDSLEGGKGSKITRKASKWHNLHGKILIHFIYFLQREHIEGWDWSQWKIVSATRVSHGSRDLPAHRSAVYSANSLWAGLSWPCLMSVCSQSIWVSSILSITKLLQDLTMSLAHPSFWGSNSAQCFWRGMRLLGKAEQAVNVRNFSLDTSVLSTSSSKTKHLLAAYAANFLSLSLKKNK